MPDLWNPSHLGPAAALVTALLLGLVHGITPDEHTWPITFSYAIGGYSTRAGLRAGLLFSASFTVQRALASQLAWFGLAGWMGLAGLDQWLYILVGVLMALGGRLLARGRALPHLHLGGRCHADDPGFPAQAAHGRAARWMPAVHGFVAGWGFGGFALILYATLAPAMPSAWLGWLPGALFGLGTALVQVAAGGLFGRMAARRHLPPEAIRAIALTTAYRTLVWGGLAYVLAGIAGLLWPRLAEAGLHTGLHVHNLATLGLPFVLAVGVVLGVGLGSFMQQLRAWRRLAAEAAPSR